jgi:hypothetical protein
LSQHAPAIENNASLRISRPDFKNFPAHQKRALGIHVHDQIPRLSLAFVKRTIPGSTRADARNVKKSVNSPKSIQTSANSVLYCKLVADIGRGAVCFMKFCRQIFAFGSIDADNKHWIFG